MVSWSSFGQKYGTFILKSYSKSPFLAQNVRFSTSKGLLGGHEQRTMIIAPSRFQYQKFKDMVHFYLMVGLIPVGLIIFYANVFIGPAQLTPIPPDYVPKHWEYHRHPITRFIARYLHVNPQQDYEKFLHFLDEEQQKVKLRILERQITDKMAERRDYQAYFYRPMVNKYLRINKQTGEEMINRLGDDYEE